MTGKNTIQSANISGKYGISLIGDEKFRELYAALLQCRILDQLLQADTRHQQWTGREASTAGVTACLRSGDSVTPTPHGLLAGYLQHGVLASSFTANPNPTEQLSAAARDAQRLKLERHDGIAVVFARAGSPKQMHRSFAEAAKDSLPLLYIFEENPALANACGSIPIIRVDACDAVAAYRVAHESIARAREGGGPTIIECVAWRRGAELQDPLSKFELYLAGKNIFSRSWKRRLEKKYRAAASAVQAFTLAESTPAGHAAAHAETIYTRQGNAVA